MAILLTQLTIFFSGTSESESERAALKTVVDELRQILEKTKNVSLKMISWQMISDPVLMKILKVK